MDCQLQDLPSEGHHFRWISCMSMCVETVKYSVTMNSKRVGNISPKRGLRHGDLMSPYLFILCAEGLTTLLKRAELRGDI